MAIANILDPIHDTLDPRVWDHAGSPSPKLKPAHKKWITKSIMDLAKQFHDTPEKWLRLVLTGSLTTYQYADTSDCDTSLFISPHFLPEWDRGKLIGLMVANMDGTKLPGTPFEMQCFVVAKNISTADLYQPGLRSGYDIASDSWLVPPDRTRSHDVEREQNIDYVYALESADKMERLLRYDPDKAVQYWHQIHKRRMRDQRAGKGDYSQANIVYKMLANRGLMPALSEVSGEYIATTLSPHGSLHDNSNKVDRGEYIAKTAARVLLNNFRPNMNHPKGPNGTEHPFIYDPADDIVHLGPANSFHWELVDRTPELKSQYNMKNKLQGAPFRFTDTHVHGRMEWPGKIVHYYGSPEPEVRQTVNDALGAREAPQDNLNESQLWLDNPA